MPERIQLRRAKGWRLPAGAVSVARPSRWGNRHRAIHQFVEETGERRWITATMLPILHGEVASKVVLHRGERAALADAVDRYRADLLSRSRPALHAWLAPLIGRDLACWCPLDQPCHADVLLDLANPEENA